MRIGDSLLVIRYYLPVLRHTQLNKPNEPDKPYRLNGLSTRRLSDTLLMPLTITSLFFSLFLTISLVPIFSRLAVRLHALDTPGPRKVHSEPMPRMGGLAMALGMLITVSLWIPKDGFVNAFIISSIIIIAFGLLDDILGIGYKTKFLGQIIATIIIISYGRIQIITLGNLLPGNMCLTDWGSYLLTGVVIVGVTNAINLSDGLDGLAGGICLLIFCCIGYLAYKAHLPIITLLSVSMVGVIFGFLRFNTYPATIFMGDTGSQLLGFAGIVLAIKLTQESLTLRPVLPLLLFGFPVLDTLAVMAQRIADGRSPFKPDKNHFHHKLIRLGFFHTEAVFIIYVIQSGLVLTALLFRGSSDRILFGGYALFCAAVLIFFYFTDRVGYRVKRYDYIDKVFKGKLRVLKERGVFIRACFKVVEWGSPGLVVLAAIVPQTIPRHVSFISMPFLALGTVSLFWKRGWLPVSIRLSVYFLLPYLLYLNQVNPAQWVSPSFLKLYNVYLGLLAVFIVLTLKFTRRQKGFKLSPMDFLIVFIVLVASILPEQGLRNYHVGMLASKIILLLFGYEVLIGELRGELARLGLATTLFVAIVAVRGFL